MVEVMVDAGLPVASVPGEAMVRHATAAACMQAGVSREVSLCVRFSDDETMREFNRQWRGRDAATDVLSFPMQEGPAIDPDEPLGDIMLAWPFVCREAERLGVDAVAHAQHLIVHGVLHLLGFVHAEEVDAARMQAMESRAMRSLGLHDPYADGHGDV